MSATVRYDFTGTTPEQRAALTPILNTYFNNPSIRSDLSAGYDTIIVRFAPSLDRDANATVSGNRLESTVGIVTFNLGTLRLDGDAPRFEPQDREVKPFAEVLVHEGVHLIYPRLTHDAFHSDPFGVAGSTSIAAGEFAFRSVVVSEYQRIFGALPSIESNAREAALAQLETLAPQTNWRSLSSEQIIQQLENPVSAIRQALGAGFRPQGDNDLPVSPVDGYSTEMTASDGDRTITTFNPDGTVNTETDYDYDSQGQLESINVLHADGRREVTAYEADGSVETSATYDSAGRLDSFWYYDGAGVAETSYSFDDAGRVDQIATFENGRFNYVYTYNDAGELQLATNFDLAGRADNYWYFAPSGQMTSQFSYDDAGRLDQIVNFDGLGRTDFVYAYDDAGRLDSTINYGTSGNFEQVWYYGDNALLTAQYLYDVNGRADQITMYDNSGATDYVYYYDDAGRVDSTINYNASGVIEDAWYYGDNNQLTAAYEFDAAGRIDQYATYGVNGAFDSVYTYDDAGRIDTLRDFADGGQSTLFTYNDNGGLIDTSQFDGNGFEIDLPPVGVDPGFDPGVDVDPWFPPPDYGWFFFFDPFW
jgi:antitoxin component YwqK of YwqJK toxin-antitoxin module